MSETNNYNIPPTHQLVDSTISDTDYQLCVVAALLRKPDWRESIKLPFQWMTAEAQNHLKQLGYHVYAPSPDALLTLKWNSNEPPSWDEVK